MNDSESKDVIEIPVGNYLNKLRENPWIISTFVFGIFFLIAVSFGSSGKVISSDKAGENALAFINSNPDLQGSVELLSVRDSGGFYEAVLGYQGQEVPVYVTRDGEYLLTGEPVPLNVDLAYNEDDSIESETGSQNQISVDDDPVLGDENAPVTIIEYSDFQCPFCQRFWKETLPLIKQNYIDTGKVKLVYRDYPIPGHPMAQPAAEAANCVRESGGDETYFEYHDILFEKQTLLSEANLIDWADELGYNIEECLASGKYEAEVQNDFADGGNLGTPTFFINGAKIEGAQPYSAFEQVIEAKLG